MPEKREKKNIDGIQKINKHGIRKSRELVLSSIGEKPKKIKEDKIKTEKTTPVNKDNKNDIRLDDIKKRDKKEEDKLNFSLEKKEKLRKVLEEKDTDSSANSIIDKIGPRTQESLYTSKAGKVVKVNKEEGAEKKKEKKKKKDILKNEKEVKKKKEIVIKKKKNKTGPSLFSVLKKKRDEVLKSTKDLFGKLKDLTKKAALLFVLVLSVFSFIYLLSAFVVLNFGKSSSFLTSVSKLIPIPALMSQDGILLFHEYSDLYHRLEADGKNIHNGIAEFFIMERLYDRYNTRDIEFLKKQLSADEDVNMAPLNRIRKIRSTIDEEGQFVKVANRLGDVDQVNLDPDNAKYFPFSASVLSMNEGETSDVIITSKGYYIVHCFGKSDEKLSLSFVHIPLVPLEQYIEDTVESYEYWNIANF